MNFLLGYVGWTKDKIDRCGLSKNLGLNGKKKKRGSGSVGMVSILQSESLGRCKL